MAASSAVCSAAAIAKLSSSRSAWSGDVSHVAVKCGGGLRFDRVAVKCRAETVEKAEIGDEEGSGMSRRLAIALLAGAAAVGGRVNPAQAAYGEAANVFGAAKPQSGFKSFSGQGFEVNLPSKWNPSKEVEFPGQVLRYEDNFDATNNLSVSVLKSEKGSIQDYGSPEELLKSLSYLLGKQSYSGETNSEGGFANNMVSIASVLESKVSEVKGKTYYTVSVLTRTADGDEGGKHHLIVATINGGKLYVLKVQAGDKRWFKGAKKLVEGTINSFNVI